MTNNKNQITVWITIVENSLIISQVATPKIEYGKANNSIRSDAGIYVDVTQQKWHIKARFLSVQELKYLT